MMTTSLRLGLALILALLTGCREASAPTDASKTDTAKPALWLVSDADTKIYILGTVHSLPPGTQWQKGEIAEAISSADSLVLEIANADDPGEAVLVFNRMSHSKDLPSIQERVAPDLRLQLEQSAKAAGLSLETLSGYETWGAALVLSNARTTEGGYERSAGVEVALLNAFRTAKKPIEGLETISQQYGYFDVLPEAEQRIMLANAIADPTKSQAQMKEAVDAWADGEPDRLAEAMNRETEATPMLKRLILTDRNARWALWIGKALDRPGVILVAVGAGHLAGAGSVQDALAKNGLKAVRIQ